MKTIIQRWNEKGGKGIFIPDQELSRVCSAAGVDHLRWRV